MTTNETNGSNFMDAVEIARKVKEQKWREAQATNAIERARKAAHERESFVPTLPVVPFPVRLRF